MITSCLFDLSNILVPIVSWLPQLKVVFSQRIWCFSCSLEVPSA